MKKYLFVKIFLIVLLGFVACRKDDIAKNIELASAVSEMSVDYPEIIEHKGVKTLFFRNKHHKDLFVDHIARMENRDKVKFTRQIGFESFLDKFYQYDDKIDSLIRHSTEKESFIEAYNAIKSIAIPYMLFMEDEAPVCRVKSPVDAALANPLGLYIIGDETIEVKQYISCEDRLSDPNVIKATISLSDENTTKLRANNAFVQTGDRKARIELRLDPEHKSIHIRCSAQAKGWFGIWHRYSTVVRGRLKITELTMPFDVPETKFTILPDIFFYPVVLKLETGHDGTLEQFPFTLEPNVQSIIHLRTEEMSEMVFLFGKFNLKEADSNEETQGVYPRMKGLIEVWSRGISYNERGQDTINVDFGI